MSFMKSVAAVAALCTTAVAAWAADDVTTIRAAMLQTGTVNWELSTIKDHGFDTANGVDLAIQFYASNDATRIALEGGEADMVVADWIWAARQRAAGKDYVFIPYSKAVGGVVVPQDSTAQSLQDLKGGKIGIAGGPLDKSWLILRAYAQKEYGLDLAAETEQVFGAPPLIMKTAMSGELTGAINFWHFTAKMKAGGMRSLIEVSTAAEALGLDPETPLLGYVLKESFIAEHPEVAQDLYHASRAAKDLLASDDAAWDAIREQMNAANDAQFAVLRDDYRAGIPVSGNVDVDAAGRLLAVMAELGGSELVGEATTVPAGLFLEIE